MSAGGTADHWIHKDCGQPVMFDLSGAFCLGCHAEGLDEDDVGPVRRCARGREEHIMSHDPADTLSNILPSLPRAERVRGGLDALDPRFPIRLSEPARIFWQLTSEWDDRETVITQTIRATQQHAVPEERFVRPMPPIDVSPAALPPPPLPVAPYQDLTPEAREREFDTLPGTAVLFAEEGPGKRKHRLKDQRTGRFIAAGGA